MPKPTTSFKKRVADIVRNVCMVVLLLFVALGQFAVVMPELEIVRTFIIFQILLLTILFSVATFLNIYQIIPRFLLRGKYVSYIGILVGITVFFVSIQIMFEWTTLKMYQLPPGDYGFFAKNNIFILDFLSTFICYLISLIATSLLVFIQHWRKSGERIRELEQTGVRVELEKARSKIDSGALFDILDKVASIVVSTPQEAIGMLMECSKSLRRQLYESEYRQDFSTLTEKTKHTFREPYPVVNFLIEKRYRLARNLLMIIAVCVIGSANIDPHQPFSLVGFATITGFFLMLGYLNVYVLLPFFFFKNRMILYFTTITLLVFVFIMILLPSDLINERFGIQGIIIISNIVQIGFIQAGITAIVLFQHWARNERHIGQLEAVTMQAELEQLQNQINPHFLFNMLNNILVLIRESPEEAVVILHKMSDMLKYQYHAGTNREALLNDEIHFLTDFLNLEKIRRDHFEFAISTDERIKDKSVPPLLFIPFVENAVKHSNDTVNLSYVRLNFSFTDDKLFFCCFNSKPLNPQKKTAYGGLGLTNIKRRLELLYDGNYSLDIREEETTYIVQLKIKI